VELGLISDTHGLLRPQALALLEGAERIIHAGDIGGMEILAALEEIAPVIAVRGNNDNGDWAKAIPETQIVEAGGARVFVIHDLAMLTPDLTAGARVVVSGHSHRPLSHTRDGVLFVNPGSAGPRRFKLPVSVGRLSISRGRVSARLLQVAT
jgi:putative phosphoesterase